MPRRELSALTDGVPPAFPPVALPFTATAALRQCPEDPAPVAQEARRLLDGLTFVHAEHYLCAVLALVGVHECHAWRL